MKVAALVKLLDQTAISRWRSLEILLNKDDCQPFPEYLLIWSPHITYATIFSHEIEEEQVEELIRDRLRGANCIRIIMDADGVKPKTTPCDHVLLLSVVFKAFDRMRSLEQLRIVSMHLEKSACGRMAEHLRPHLPSLRALDLSNNSICSEGVMSIINALGVADNSIYSESTRSPVVAKELWYLSFENNPICRDGSLLGILDITKYLENTECLIELNLRSTDMNTAGVSFISNAIGRHKELRILRLGHNRIRTEGLSCLVETLAVLVQLQLLDLAGNELNGAAIWEMCKVARKVPWKVLDLSENPDMAIEAMRFLFPQLQYLTALNLSRNKMFPVGIKKLCTALSQSMPRPPLRALNLEINAITNAALGILAKTLRDYRVETIVIKEGIGDPLDVSVFDGIVKNVEFTSMEEFLPLATIINSLDHRAESF